MGLTGKTPPVGDAKCKEGVFVGAERRSCRCKGKHKVHEAIGMNGVLIQWGGEIGKTEYDDSQHTLIMSKEGNPVHTMGRNW